jgi:sigma-B regulation protein RsbU (phosphoserine phosphatase)
MSATTVSLGEGQRLVQEIFSYARRIGQERDREALLKILADMGRDLVGADRCSIWLLDESRQELFTRVAHGTGILRIEATQGLVGRSIATGEPVFSNALVDERRSAEIDRQTGYQTRSVLVVPMRGADGRIIGAFQALNKPQGFTPADGDLLALAAAYSASTIEAQQLQAKAEEVRRLEHELAIAREVQQRLLPGAQLPTIDGLDLTGTCRPASEVGGDYYEVLRTADRLLIAVGDVSGKGISAALMMASVQASLKGLVLQAEQNLSLCDIMTKLNQIVYESSTPSRYSTLFIAQYQPVDKKLTMVNAGHVPPLILHSDGTSEQFDSDGPPIGLLPNISYTERQVTVKRGDVLISCSDGITECHNPDGEMWDGEEFESQVRTLHRESAAETVAGIMRAADAHMNGTKPHDDMTLVCVRWPGHDLS